jgi:hypothetical protein
MFNAFNTPLINRLEFRFVRLTVTLHVLMQIIERTALVCLGQDIVALAHDVKRFEPGRLKRDRWKAYLWRTVMLSQTKSCRKS